MPPVLRQGLFFCLIFVGTGVSTPYAPVWLASVGLGAPTIGLIIALPMILRPFVAPPLALWADGFLLRRTPIGLLGLAAAVCYGLMLVVKGALLWGLFWFIAATAISSASPLTDVLTLRRAEKEGFDYAAARGVGSAGYVGGYAATAFVDGQLRVDRPIATIGPTEIRAGGGAWGGAQQGANRLDVGPTASVKVSSGQIGARLGVDWRFRVVGDAAPSSGPAMTLAAGF